MIKITLPADEPDSYWLSAAKNVFGTSVEPIEDGSGEVTDDFLPGEKYWGKYYHYHEPAFTAHYKSISFTFIKNVRIVDFLNKSSMKKSKDTGYPVMHMTIHNKTASEQKILCSRIRGRFKKKRKEGWKKNEKIHGYEIWTERWMLTEEEKLFLEQFTIWMKEAATGYCLSRFGQIIYFNGIDTIIMYEGPGDGTPWRNSDVFRCIRHSLDVLRQWK